MEMVRQEIVFDAPDPTAESALWAGILGGHVYDGDERFHCVFDASGVWRIGVQLAPNHVPPDWPDGIPQQIHLDLHVEEILGRRIKKRSPSAPGCSRLLPTSMPTKGTGSTQTQPTTRSASAGHPSPEQIAIVRRQAVRTGRSPLKSQHRPVSISARFKLAVTIPANAGASLAKGGQPRTAPCGHVRR